MVLVFTIKEQIYLERLYKEEYDPLGGNKGIALAVIQRYITCFGIPLNGTRKLVKAHSIGTNQPVPVLLWTDSMKAEADKMLPLVHGMWKKRLFLPLTLSAIVILIAAFFYSGISNDNKKKTQVEYFQNPEPGDIILANVMTSFYVDTDQPSALMVFRVERISGDSLILKRNSTRLDPMEMYKIKDKDKLLELFDTSAAAFASSTSEVYSLAKYREQDERLRRIELTGLSEQEQEKEEDLRKKTDIIEVDYIKRPDANK
ncbi:MAG: hypothetical protein ACLVKO_07100 [Dysgonomonas sp.]